MMTEPRTYAGKALVAADGTLALLIGAGAEEGDHVLLDFALAIEDEARTAALREVEEKVGEMDGLRTNDMSLDRNDVLAAIEALRAHPSPDAPHPTLSQPWGDPDYDHSCEDCRSGRHGRLRRAPDMSARPLSAPYSADHIADLRTYHNPCGWSCASSVDGTDCEIAHWLATLDAASSASPDSRLNDDRPCGRCGTWYRFHGFGEIQPPEYARDHPWEPAASPDPDLAAALREALFRYDGPLDVHLPIDPNDIREAESLTALANHLARSLPAVSTEPDRLDVERLARAIGEAWPKNGLASIPQSGPSDALTEAIAAEYERLSR